MIKINSIVKLKIPPTDDPEIKGKVNVGALGVCVDGKKKFPELYKSVIKKVGYVPDDFVWIEWLKCDPRYDGRIDGLYWELRFDIVKNELN